MKCLLSLKNLTKHRWERSVTNHGKRDELAGSQAMEHKLPRPVNGQLHYFFKVTFFNIKTLSLRRDEEQK